MKKNILPLLSTILLVGILLSACTTGATSSSWGGATLSDSAVYYAGGTKIFALRPDNGNVIWSYPEKPAAGQLFLAAPVITGDQVIVGDYANILTSLKPTDGSVNWTFTTAKGKYVGSPLITPDLIIAPNADNNLYALDLQGKLKWTFAATHSFWSQPITDGKNVFASSLDHFLYAVDLQTGKLVWKVDLGASLVSAPLFDNGVLYQGTIVGNMNAVDAATGKVKWTQKVDAGIWSAPVLVDGKLYFGDQTSKVYILNSTDGSLGQSIDVGAGVIGNGVALKEGIAFGTEKGDLVLISLDGTKLWTHTIGGKLYSNLTANSSLILVVETQGDKPLVALDTNGTEQWYFAGK